MRAVISSGHGLKVRGACGILDEVDEARNVVNTVADMLASRGVKTTIYHDDVSKSQSENLERIVDFHNAQANHDIDISVHFNAFEQTANPRGTEVLYVSQSALASKMSSAIAMAGNFIDRGGKKDEVGLYFLRHTAKPAILIEVCFVDSEADCNLYQSNFDAICEAIADIIAEDEEVGCVVPPTSWSVTGKCSYFGGPDDEGVSASEGLAFIYDVMDAPHLFLPYQPEGTTGLARRLNPFVHYVAVRWDYGKASKASLLQAVARVKALKTGIALDAFPADWGPNQNTGRVADLSPGLMEDLGIETDDEVEIIFPWKS